MDSQNLHGKKIAMIATDGFEQAELIETKHHLESAGAQVQVLSLHDEIIRGWYHGNWGEGVKVDQLIADAHPQDFDALVIPGGVMNADKLRMEPKVIQFVNHFVERGKTIGAICHGPWVLVETTALEGRTVTSWPSLKTDLVNAGAKWVDQSVVSDNGLVTSRKPDDIPAFAEKLIEEINAGIHEVNYDTSIGF